MARIRPVDHRIGHVAAWGAQLRPRALEFLRTTPTRTRSRIASRPGCGGWWSVRASRKPDPPADAPPGSARLYGPEPESADLGTMRWQRTSP